MHLYYLPCAPTERYESKADLCLSAPLADGVLTDLLTGEVFSLPAPTITKSGAVYEKLPISNYPFLIAESQEIEIESK